jgi:hypothetical protein
MLRAACNGITLAVRAQPGAKKTPGAPSFVRLVHKARESTALNPGRKHSN